MRTVMTAIQAMAARLQGTCIQPRRKGPGAKRRCLARRSRMGTTSAWGQASTCREPFVII